MRSFEGHSNAVLGVACSPDGRLLASNSAGWDDAIILRNPVTGTRVGTIAADPIGVHSVVFSTDGRLLASAGALTAGEGGRTAMRTGH